MTTFLKMGIYENDHQKKKKKKLRIPPHQFKNLAVLMQHDYVHSLEVQIHILPNSSTIFSVVTGTQLPYIKDSSLLQN